MEESLDEAKKLREQARIYFNAGALKLKREKHMRKEAEKYYSAAARKFEKHMLVKMTVPKKKQ